MDKQDIRFSKFFTVVSISSSLDATEDLLSAKLSSLEALSVTFAVLSSAVFSKPGGVEPDDIDIDKSLQEALRLHHSGHVSV